MTPKKYYKSKLKIVDSITNEQLEGITVVRGAKKTKFKSQGGFLVMFQNKDVSMDLVSNRAIDGTSWRVFWYMLHVMSYENFVHVSQKEIAEAVKIHVNQVSRSIKNLVNEGLIIKVPLKSNCFVYRVNLGLVWKGKPQSYNENIKQLEKKSAKDLAKERWSMAIDEHLK